MRTLTIQPVTAVDSVSERLQHYEWRQRFHVSSLTEERTALSDIRDRLTELEAADPVQESILSKKYGMERLQLRELKRQYEARANGNVKFYPTALAPTRSLDAAFFTRHGIPFTRIPRPH